MVWPVYSPEESISEMSIPFFFKITGEISAVRSDLAAHNDIRACEGKGERLVEPFAADMDFITPAIERFALFGKMRHLINFVDIE